MATRRAACRRPVTVAAPRSRCGTGSTTAHSVRTNSPIVAMKIPLPAKWLANVT
jgi:hypothetical protein